MKKLLVILMVVAMASFLFVGCNFTDPDVDEDEEPDPTPPPTTVAPVITSVPDAADGYVNKAEAKDGLVVNGTGPTYSEIRVYISGLTAGTGDVTATGAWTVEVANADLIKAVKTDGEKVLYAKATETGLAESASSNQIKFTLDTKLPTIEKCSAKAGTHFIAGNAASATKIKVCPKPAVLALTIINPANVVDGTWTVDITSPIMINNVVITDPDGNEYTYSCVPGTVFPAGAPIPGVKFKLVTTFAPPLVAKCSQIVCVAAVPDVPAVPGYIDVTFNEPVTSASKLAPPAGTGLWTAFGATNDLEPVVTVTGTTKARLTEDGAFIPYLVAGVAYAVSCSGPTDLAGNSIPASSPETCTGVVMP